MLKQTINYEDFDGNHATEVVYFNLTKAELTDQFELQDRIQHLQNKIEAANEDSDMSREDVRDVLNLIKDLMKLSYGQKSADGKRFVKSPELWTEFTQTAAYDAFLFSLFENPTKANEFMMGIFPKDLMEQAVGQIENVEAPVLQLVKTETASKDPVNMTREELIEAMRQKLKDKADKIEE